MGVSRTIQRFDDGADSVDDLDVVELELLKLVRHLETFGRRSSLYQEVDRAGYIALRTLDGLGPSCINRLAQELHLDSSTVTRQVGVLESGGLVTRHVDPNDGRSWLIDLTSRGRKAMRTVERGRHHAIDSMLRGWSTEEVHDLARMITKLNLALFDSVTEQSAPGA
jgi:DNA-binding MarR family transcriptional regulator